MQKNYHNDIISALNFLRKGRVQLYTPFLKHDALLIVGPSFRYENNEPAFDLVKDQYFTLWLDSQFKSLFSQKNFSKEVHDLLLKAVESIFSTILHSKESKSIFDLQLIRTKEKIVNELLLKVEDMDKKLNELKFAYDKDKALFERKLKEYE